MSSDDKNNKRKRYNHEAWSNSSNNENKSKKRKNKKRKLPKTNNNNCTNNNNERKKKEKKHSSSKIYYSNAFLDKATKLKERKERILRDSKNPLNMSGITYTTIIVKQGVKNLTINTGGIIADSKFRVYLDFRKHTIFVYGVIDEKMKFNKKEKARFISKSRAFYNKNNDEIYENNIPRSHISKKSKIFTLPHAPECVIRLKTIKVFDTCSICKICPVVLIQRDFSAYLTIELTENASISCSISARNLILKMRGNSTMKARTRFGPRPEQKYWDSIVNSLDVNLSLSIILHPALFNAAIA